jgi:hypothetical protein
MLPKHASNGPVPIENVANAMEAKVDASTTELPAANTAEPSGSNALPGGTATNVATPAHDKDMAKRFLAALDPNASRFTFQFFNDHGGGYAEILHGTLDEVWPKIQALNIPGRGIGAFVTINETDLKGRNSKNILHGRALFVDADSEEQGKRCFKAFSTCGAAPSMAVSTGRGWHFYFLTDVPRDQFSPLQKSLIDKVETDPAIKDLPRVMRLPGTLHLKNPAEPRVVKLLNPPNSAVRRWKLSDLVAKLGLCSVDPASTSHETTVSSIFPDFVQPAGERSNELFCLAPEPFAIRPEANMDEIRSAVAAIPPAAIATEPDWMKLARALAHEAAVHEHKTEPLWEILDTASSKAPGYNEAENRQRFLRYIGEALNSDDPITLATLFHWARLYGWQWSPSIAAASPAKPAVWVAANLKPSFVNIPHRRWLYGYHLIRGEVTILAAPGGAGKTALATGMAVEIATSAEILAERIYGSDLKVLFINGEDGRSEIERRVYAFSLAHADKLRGLSFDRLYVVGADDEPVQRISFLRPTDGNFSTLDRGGFEVLEDALATLRPDAVILDPLIVFCGGGNINDNALMAQVLRELKRLAGKFDCALLVVHHTRKDSADGNAEAVSGASAIVNLARRAIMPVTMTSDEMKALGVLPSERLRHFKLVDAKSNFAPRSTDSPWYKLHSVELPNADPPLYQHGDNVQAVQRVTLPLLQTEAQTTGDQKIQDAIFDLIDRGKVIDGQAYPYSPSPAGATKERALLDDAMAAVRNASAPRQWRDDDLKTVVIGALKTMKAEGRVIEEEIKKGRFRKGRGLAVAPLSPASVQATWGDDIPGHPTTLDGETPTIADNGDHHE